MSGARRFLLMGLVLTNLAFVHITRAASPTWLLPLVILTLASPLLVPFRHRLAYRLLWNGAVIGVFCLLVHHATSRGVHLLLEDGLLLAALCQVHLLNNIGFDQKPDLLFFNSFLIAVVTSVLSLDFAYSMVFLVYAPLLLLAMQVNNLAAIRGAEISGAVFPRVLRDGLGKAAVVLAVTMLLFFFLPRDFHRRGLLGDQWRFSPPGGLLDVDFSEEIELGRSGDVRASDRVVMRVVLERGERLSVPSHWRGATLDRFDGRRWRPVRSSAVAFGQRWMGDGRGRWERPGLSPGPRVRVSIDDPRASRLFAPLLSRVLVLEPPVNPRLVEPLPDLTILYPGAVARRGPIGYRLELVGNPPAPGGRSIKGRARDFVNLARSAVPARAREIAREIAGRHPKDVEQHVLVAAMRHHLESGYEYMLPGEDGAAGSLAEFLEGEAGGHCEYFASALAVMLRTQGIPCRLVTGFRSDEWDVAGRVLTIRARNAHAWVEVLDPKAGWTTVDPSPAVDFAGAGSGGEGLLADLGKLARDFWRQVTGFNAEARDRALAWMRAAPGRALATARERPHLPGLAIALLAAVFAGVRLARRRRVPREVRDYRRSVNRAKLDLRKGETPRELLRRARRSALPPARLKLLEQGTTRHEGERYGIRPN